MQYSHDIVGYEGHEEELESRVWNGRRWPKEERRYCASATFAVCFVGVCGLKEGPSATITVLYCTVLLRAV